MNHIRQHTRSLFVLAILLIIVGFTLVADADLTITVEPNKKWDPSQYQTSKVYAKMLSHISKNTSETPIK